MSKIDSNLEGIEAFLKAFNAEHEFLVESIQAFAECLKSLDALELGEVRQVIMDKVLFRTVKTVNKVDQTRLEIAAVTADYSRRIADIIEGTTGKLS